MGADRAVVLRALAIVERISPILSGHGPEIQGAVLAQLTVLWASGWQVPHAARLEILRGHYAGVTEMLAEMTGN